EKEPLAADVRPRSNVSMRELKRLALLRLIAVILGVKFDDLRQRDLQRERKRKLTWAALAAVLALLIGGGGLAYWEIMRPKIGYYRQLVWRWGVPEGLGSLNDEARSHLLVGYRITTQRGRVTDIRYVASLGTLRPDSDGQSHWVLHYPED